MTEKVVTSTRTAPEGTFGTAIQMKCCPFDGTNLTKIEDPTLVNPNGPIEAYVCPNCRWLTYFLKR